MKNIKTKVPSTNKKNNDKIYLSTDENVPLSILSSKPHSSESSTNRKLKVS